MTTYYNLSPNMSLPVPIAGVDPGPDWASNLNNSLTILDSHNHSAGSGVQINPAGININADFPLNSNNLVLARSLKMISNGSALVLASDIGCLNVVGGDLYYNNLGGVPVRITNANSLAGASGTIANLSSPASATYVSASSTFVWQSNATVPASMDAGSYIFRNITANSNGITVTAPSSLASSYAITLPALPSSTRVLSIDSSGNMGAGSSGVVVTADIATQNITTALIADGNVTQVKRVALNIVSSSINTSFSTTSTSPVSVTGVSVTITTTGRPIFVGLVGDATNLSFFSVGGASHQNYGAVAYIYNGGSAISSHLVCGGSFSTNTTFSTYAAVSSVYTIDAQTAGTYTYSLAMNTQFSGTTAGVQYVQIVAYEL